MFRGYNFFKNDTSNIDVFTYLLQTTFSVICGYNLASAVLCQYSSLFETLQKLGDGLAIDEIELVELTVVSCQTLHTIMTQLFIFRSEFTIQNIHHIFGGYLFYQMIYDPATSIMWHNFSFSSPAFVVIILSLTLVFAIFMAVFGCVYIYPSLGVYITYDIVKGNFETTPEAIVMGPRPVMTISYSSQALMFKALKSTSVLEEILHALGEDGRYQLTWELYGLHTSHTIRSFRTILNSYHNLCQESVMIKGRTDSLTA